MKKTILFFALGGTLALSAQTPHFGVQGALSLPTNRLSDNGNTGLQLGGHAKWDFRGGHGLMGRADVAFYGQNHDIDVTNLAAAADYTYHLERGDQGAYLLGGVALQHYHTSFPGNSRNDGGLGLDLGAGYDLDRHLGLQVRYTTASFNDFTYSALNLGVTYTF